MSPYKTKNFYRISSTLVALGLYLLPGEAFAAQTPQQLSKSLQSNPIIEDLNTIVNFLSGAVAIAVIGSLILGGIQYTTAGGNPDAVGKAKKRITDSLIAIAIFMFLFAFLQWLIPGGVFG